jgi:hypothetical protein
VGSELAQGVLDRRANRLAEHVDDLVDRPRAVEQGQERRDQPLRGPALEADEALAVLEHDFPGAGRNAVPGRQVGERGHHAGHAPLPAGSTATRTAGSR